jgi:peptidyl-dipeptidase Dcp
MPSTPGLPEKLETHILSAGGSEDAAELYRVPGPMPGVEALLKGRGLDKVA